MNESLARIHARVCGDGNVSKYETCESDRNRRAEVVYTNYDEQNLKEFREDLKSEFGVKGTRYKQRLRVKSIRLVEGLEDKFGEFGSKDFRVPECIHNSSEEIKLEWLRAFIRDEGYYEKENNRLRIKLMNKSALEDIQKIFSDIEVKAKITGKNCDGSWYLTVPKLDRYNKIESIAENKSKVKGK